MSPDVIKFICSTVKLVHRYGGCSGIYFYNGSYQEDVNFFFGDQNDKNEFYEYNIFADIL